MHPDDPNRLTEARKILLIAEYTVSQGANSTTWFPADGMAPDVVASQQRELLHACAIWHEVFDWMEKVMEVDVASGVVGTTFFNQMPDWVDDYTYPSIIRLNERLWAMLPDAAEHLHHRVGSVNHSTSWETRRVFARIALAQLEHIARSSATPSVTQINEAVDRAEQAAESAQRAAGNAADSELSSEMDRFAKDQIRTSDRFRWAAIGSSVLAIVVGALSLLIYPPGQAVTDVAARLAIFAAVAGLGGYFGFQSSRHRRVGEWCAVLAIQLKTFGAYLEPIDSADVRDDIRRQFAARAFSPIVDSSDASGTDANVTWMQQVIGLMATKRG